MPARRALPRTPSPTRSRGSPRTSRRTDGGKPRDISRWCDGRAVAAGPAGAGEPAHDVGVTALALLAFLRAPGIGLRSPKYDAHVARGLDWLRAQQDAEGCVGTRDELRFVYDHAWAALALVEGATANPGSRGLAKAAQRALDFWALARNPYFAWRYGVKPGDNDTSVTGAMLAALAAARDADRSRSSGSATFSRPRFEVDLEAFDGAEAWVDKMTDQSSRVGYAQRGGPPARSWEQVDRFPGPFGVADRVRSRDSRVVRPGHREGTHVPEGPRAPREAAPRVEPRRGDDRHALLVLRYARVRDDERRGTGCVDERAACRRAARAAEGRRAVRMRRIVGPRRPMGARRRSRVCDGGPGDDPRGGGNARAPSVRILRPRGRLQRWVPARIGRQAASGRS